MDDNIYLIKDDTIVIETVSKRIKALFLIDDFKLSIDYIKAIHAYLFRDLLITNGKFRDHEIEKTEPTINNASVAYAEHHTINTYLSYSIKEIENFNPRSLTEDTFISFIAKLTLNLWITHPFVEGNTRTISVFIQKYLSLFGYNPNPEFFKDNFNYFRGALVKAAYTNELYHVEPDLEPLCKFYRCFLFDNSIPLEEADIIVSKMFNPVKSKRKALKISDIIKKILFTK